MLLLMIPGIVSLVFGVSLLFMPRRLKRRAASKARGWIETDALLLTHQIATGICLIAVGVFCLTSAGYVWIRLHL